MKIFNREDIINNTTKINNCMGIYFLIRDNKIIYVGESNNVYERIQCWYNHESKKRYNNLYKNFDSYFVHILPDLTHDERRTLEAIYILIYKPLYNSDIPHMNRSTFNKYLPMIKKAMVV